MPVVITRPYNILPDPDPYYTHITTVGPTPTFYWPLRETSGVVANEVYVGGGMNGVYQNATLNQTSLTPSASTKAVAFNGTNTSYVSALGIDSSLNFIHQTGVFTISAWVSVDVVPSGTDMCVMGNEAATNGVGFGWLWDDAVGTDALRFFIARNTGGSYAIDVSRNNIVTSASTPYHLAVKGDGTNFWFYVNGTEYTATGTLNYGYFLGDADREATIAALNYTTVLSPLDGIVEDVAVWNSTLSAGQILAQYNAG